MTEEIKEIIECLKTMSRENEPDIELSREEVKLLLDYITNLQQENEKLKYNARGQVNDYFKDKYTDEVLKNAELKIENEMLKEYIKMYKCDYSPLYKELNGSDEK